MKNLVILFVLYLAFGCSESNTPKASDENTFLEQLKSAPRADVSKENLPEWLVKRINEYEKEPPPPIVLIQIYKGEWNKQVVYFITSIHFSCLFCNVYYENGEQVLFEESGQSDHFYESCKNWALIYQYGKELI